MHPALSVYLYFLLILLTFSFYSLVLLLKQGRVQCWGYPCLDVLLFLDLLPYFCIFISYVLLCLLSYHHPTIHISTSPCPYIPLDLQDHNMALISAGLSCEQCYLPLRVDLQYHGPL